jgi:tetratricopeptide (TPR) repeat protein
LCFSKKPCVRPALAEVNKALEIDQNLDWAHSVRDAVQADIKRVEVQGKQTTVKTSEDYQLCADESADYKQRGMACDRFISLGTLANPELLAAYLGRGWMRYKDNQPGLASADYGKAIELDPKDASAYGGRGRSYYARGDHDRAIADYNKAIELNPNDATTYYNRGIAYDTKGEHDRAIADYNKAIEPMPTTAAAAPITPGATWRTRCGTSTRPFELTPNGRSLAPTGLKSSADRACSLKPWPMPTRRSRSTRTSTGRAAFMMPYELISSASRAAGEIAPRTPELIQRAASST